MKPNSLGTSFGILGLLSTSLLAGTDTSSRNGSLLAEPSQEEAWVGLNLSSSL
ncbi:MAG: hypothetical protein ABJQ29_08250 [Luteolibacter sp.]